MKKKQKDAQGCFFFFESAQCGFSVNPLCHAVDSTGQTCLIPATHFERDAGLPVCDLHKNPAHLAPPVAAPRVPGQKRAARRPAVPKRVGY